MNRFMPCFYPKQEKGNKKTTFFVSCPLKRSLHVSLCDETVPLFSCALEKVAGFLYQFTRPVVSFH